MGLSGKHRRVLEQISRGGAETRISGETLADAFIKGGAEIVRVYPIGKKMHGIVLSVGPTELDIRRDHTNCIGAAHRAAAVALLLHANRENAQESDPVLTHDSLS